MIRVYLVLFVAILSLSNSAIAEEKDLIPEIEVNKIQNKKIEDLSWQDEISKLTLEVEDLKDQVVLQEEEKKELKKELEEYRKKEESNNTRVLRIERLKRILSKPVFSVEEIDDKNLEFAYSAILLSNIEQAKVNLSSFIGKNIKDNPNYYKEVEIPIKKTKELIKDPLNVNGQRGISVVPDNMGDVNNKNPFETKKEKIVDTDFVANYQKALDKANYLIGEIYLVEINPQESVPYLVEAYNKSKDPDIIILSLIGITESYTILKKYPEACVSIQRIERTLERIKQIDPDYILSPSDESFIERIKEISLCQASE